MNESAKNALRKAIRDFFSPEDIFDEATMRELAQEYVYNHDEEIREHFRDRVDMDDYFESVLEDIDYYDLW